MAKKILFVTSEVSGDLITSYLAKNLLALDKDLSLAAVAGAKTKAVGVKVIANSATFGSMRIGWVPLWQIFEYYRQRNLLRKKALAYLEEKKIDFVILVDLNGFSAYFLKILAEKKIPYLCYIPSQEWVMGKVTKQMKTFASSKAPVVSIFPEEHAFYSKLGINSVYLGHPLVDICKNNLSKEEARKNLSIGKNVTLVTLLPLSRKQEVSFILPVILKTADKIRKKQPQIHFCFSLIRLDLKSEIESVLKKFKGLAISFSEDNYSAIKAADLVIAKSGTVNLETALLGTPQIVFYRLSSLSYFVAKYILRINFPRFISPVNLMLGKKVVPEFIQTEANPEKLSQEALKLLSCYSKKSKKDPYKGLKTLMGEKDSLKRAAKKIIELLEAI